MILEKTETVNKWKDDRYKVRVQYTIGPAGPGTYHFLIKEKKPGSIAWKRLIDEGIPYKTNYDGCRAAFYVEGDSLVVNTCAKTIVRMQIR